MDTKVTLSGWELSNPVIPCSGTFGYGKEFAELYDLNILGSFSFKGTTVEPRFGNPTPRIAEADDGILNSVGLQNPGMEHVRQVELPEIKKYFGKKVIANLSGSLVEDYVELCRQFNEEEQVALFEINISCPNVKCGGMGLGTRPETAYEVTRAVKTVAKKPVYMKLSPNVTDIAGIAKACEEGGADGISLINTLTGMKIDINRRAFAIANKTGGMSGPAVKPVAVRMVYQVAQAVKLPIIGMGGIMNADDAIEFILAGASAVAVGTANFHNPYATEEIVKGIDAYMEKYGIEDIHELIGAVR